MIKNILSNIILIIILVLLVPLIIVSIIFLIFFQKKRKMPRLFWGATPIINNKYWSNSLRELGFESETVMKSFYLINSNNDFNKVLNQICFFKIKIPYKIISPFAFLYILFNYDILCICYDGGVLPRQLLFFELFIYKLIRKKILVIPYGGDSYEMSKINDYSYKHSLLINYPTLSRNEKSISKNVEIVNRFANIRIPGNLLYGTNKWDILCFSCVVIDTMQWQLKSNKKNNNGKNGAVKILHTPNHRGVKGTEFIIKAVNQLKEEGLNVELVLIEKKPNEFVRKMMQECDILAEALIFTAYGLSAIEGMVSGLPVMSNLTEDSYTKVFKRFGYLNHCPIMPTNPENVLDNLRTLVTNPELRKELGQKGRQYVEKYHSYPTFQLMFSRIYQKIWLNQDVDLINYFHPLIGQYEKDYEVYKEQGVDYIKNIINQPLSTI